MALLIDTSLWVDFTREKSPRALKQFLASYVLDPSACLAEPVAFEIFRHALPKELPNLTRQFALLPVLPTPDNIWGQAAALGRVCRQKGYTAGAVDLLIAAVALAHDAEVVTLDEGIYKLGQMTGVRVKLLTRP